MKKETVDIDAKAIRAKLGLNQTEFWRPLGVTQSRASRYESCRRIPGVVKTLLLISYGTERQRKAALAGLGVTI